MTDNKSQKPQPKKADGKKWPTIKEIADRNAALLKRLANK